MFPAASYQYVLFGMGFRMDVDNLPLQRGMDNAQRAFNQNATLKSKWTKALPTNRDLINKIKTHGLHGRSSALGDTCVWSNYRGANMRGCGSVPI